MTAGGDDGGQSARQPAEPVEPTDRTIKDANAFLISPLTMWRS